MLKGLLATAIASAIKPSELHAVPGYEHLPRDASDLRYFRSLFTDPAALADFREAPTESTIARVLRVLSRTSTEWTNAIRRAVGLVHPGAQVLRNPDGHHIGNGTLLKVPDTRRGARANSYRYVVVTAWHVAELVPAPDGSTWVRHPGNADIAVREVSEAEKREWTGEPHAMSLKMSSERVHDDIGGKVGVVLGKDSDTGSMLRKMYPSLVSPRVTRQFLRACGLTDAAINERLYQHDEFRLIVLPPEEMITDRNGHAKPKGMSGSAYVYLPEGSSDVEFGGIFIAISPANSDNTTFLLGHVADHFQVREAIDHLFLDSGHAVHAQAPIRTEPRRVKTIPFRHGNN